MDVRLRSRALLLTIGLLTGGLLLPTTAHADPGDLARSFGKAGHRDLGAGYEADLVRIAKGRVVVAGVAKTGAVKVQMVSARGDRVRGFGKRGVKVLGKGTYNSRVNVTWMPKRQLVIVNAHYNPDGNQYARLWALKPNGALATGFGNDGTVTHGPGFWNDVQARGRKLLVIGQSQVARLQPDGLTFDQSFNGGTSVVDLLDPGLVLQEIHLHRRGFFVSGASREGLEVFRLTGGGRRDTGWGDGTGNSTWAPSAGSATPTGYEGGLMDVRTRSGAIVYLGAVRATYNGTEYLYRVTGALKPNGYLDEDFRNGENLSYRPGGGPVALGSGRVLVPSTVYGDDRYFAAVTRLKDQGEVDGAFGVRGSFRDQRGSAEDMVAVLPPKRGPIIGLVRGYREDSGTYLGLVGIQP
jgi:hypothetical protein